MADPDLDSALRAAEAAALSVGDLLHDGLRNPGLIDSKSEVPWDVVTVFDVETEKRLTETLSAFDAGIPVRGEELGGDTNAATTWLIDPIDGTGCFVRGLPEATTMITLIHDHEAVVAVINCFATAELFSAVKGGGATLNGETIRISERPLRSAYVHLEMNKNVDGNLELQRTLENRTGIVNYMCSGYVYAMSACGRLDGRINKDGWGHDWDYAPGSLIYAEAGGVVANIGTTTYDYRNHDSLALSPTAFAALTEGPEALFPLR